MRIFFFFALLFTLACLPADVQAQSRFEFIYADSTNKQDSIIDFGAARPGVPVFKPVTIKNLSKDTVWLDDFVVGFIAILDDIKNPGRFREFSVVRADSDAALPYPVIIPPQDSFKFRVKFDPATTGESEALGRKTGFLSIQLNKYPTNDVEIVSRKLFLTVEKTKKLLVARRDTVRFDSVYVGSTALKDWVVINASTVAVAATQTLSPSVGEFAERDVLKIAQPGPAKFIPIELSYSPVNRGFDSARIKATYEFGTEPDTITSLITGFGAEQQLDLTAAKVNGTALPILDYSQTPDAGDTVDIGNVIVGTNIRLTLDFKNLGNISFKALKDTIAGSPAATIDLRFSAASLDTMRTRTVDLVLVPTQMGRIVAEYILESDISSRVKGAPAHARKRSVFIVMRGIEAVLSSASQLPFGDLEILEGCRRSEPKNLVITNTGNIPLTIESAFIQSGIDFALVKPFNQPVDILPGESYTFAVNFSPGTMGLKTDALVITNSSSQPVRTIPLQGLAVDRQSLALALPQDIRTRPGSLIRVPITGNGKLLQRASQFQAYLTFDTTLLKPYLPEFVVTSGTASAGSAVTYDSGTKFVMLSSEFGFADKDTLAFLQFETFLGNKIDSEVLPQNVMLSSSDCKEVSLFKSVNVQTGRIALDSACGLNFKIGGGSGRFRFQSAVPAPARERSEIEYEVAFTTGVSITVYDSYGRIIQRPVEEEQSAGTYYVTVPTAHLTPGVYFCEMRAGIYHAVQQIIVAE